MLSTPTLVLLSLAGASMGLSAMLVRAASGISSGTRARAALGLAGGLGAIALLCLALVLRGPASKLERKLLVGGVEPRPFPLVDGIRRGPPSETVRDIKTSKGKPIFDVTYTFDGWGHRVTPEAPDRPAVVFFGCSYTFGEGLSDHQTLPWQFALDTGRRFDVVNAALGGFGPQQMLRMLEAGMLDARVPLGVVHAFHLAIPDHVGRAANGRFWDRTSPRYELDGEGIRLAGPMRSPLGGLFVDTAQYVLGREWEPPWEKPVPADDERWARIVERSSGLVRAKWGAPLTVILWDAGPPGGRRLGKLLRDRGLDVIFVSDLVPKPRLRVIPGDGHPAATTNEALARALAERYFPPTGRRD